MPKKKKRKPRRFRHELKYIITLPDAKRLYKDLEVFCDYDKHADATRSYEIASVYYDTEDLRFYFDREESVGYRRKIRLRVYNKDHKSRALFIEIKEKHKNFVHKKRINCVDMSILDLDIPHNKLPLDLVIDHLEDSAEAREMAYLHKRLNLKPTVIIRYIRKAIIPRDEHDMRITLDTKITAGGDSLPVYKIKEEKPIIPPNLGVLEIKSNRSIPLWLNSTLKHYRLTQTRYSKYCLGIDKIYKEGDKLWLPADDAFARSDHELDEGPKKDTAVA